MIQPLLSEFDSGESGYIYCLKSASIRAPANLWASQWTSFNSCRRKEQTGCPATNILYLYELILIVQGVFYCSIKLHKKVPCPVAFSSSDIRTMRGRSLFDSWFQAEIIQRCMLSVALSEQAAPCQIYASHAFPMAIPSKFVQSKCSSGTCLAQTLGPTYKETQPRTLLRSCIWTWVNKCSKRQVHL